MYKDHFGLLESPFRITPHTGRFFSGAQRGATLEALAFAIQHDEGIIRVTGEVGTGKTMLCRMLLERLPDSVTTLYIANPSLSPQELLDTVREELGLPAESSPSLLRSIETRLIELHAAGKKVVVLIDEAHAMPAPSLEQIRLLSNLETSTHKLLQIVLFGQPELNDLLAVPAMRSLRERITQSFALEPLRLSDVAAYLDFRLRAAGYKGPELFGEGPIAILAQASQGLTRRINILADKALLAAFAENTHTITKQHIRMAVNDAQFAPLSANLSTHRKKLVMGATLILLGIVVVLGLRPVAPSAPDAAKPSANPRIPAIPPKTASSVPLQAPVATQSLPGTAATSASVLLGPLAQELLTQSRQKIDTIPDDQWFIQLRSSSAKDSLALESFVTAAHKYLQSDLLQIYLARDTPGPQVGVIYGPFADAASAQKTLNRLPAWARGQGAYLRRYKSLR